MCNLIRLCNLVVGCRVCNIVRVCNLVENDVICDYYGV